MAGSGDIEGLEDTMANRGMTELEALLFHAFKTRYEVGTEEDGDSLARYVAMYITTYLPEVKEDAPYAPDIA